MPRRSSWLSAAFGRTRCRPRRAGAWAGRRRSSGPGAAGLMFTVISGSWQVASATSSSRLLPQRFSGLLDHQPGGVLPRWLRMGRRDPERHGVGRLRRWAAHVPGERGVELAEQRGAVEHDVEARQVAGHCAAFLAALSTVRRASASGSADAATSWLEVGRVARLGACGRRPSTGRCSGCLRRSAATHATRAAVPDRRRAGGRAGAALGGSSSRRTACQSRRPVAGPVVEQLVRPAAVVGATNDGGAST